MGTAIANAALRPPVLAAKTAAQLDQASDGRFLLGLGVGNDVMNGRFGLPPFPPLQMIEEYVGALRAALAGRPAGFDGQLFRTGMVPFDSPPVRAELRSTWPRLDRGCSSSPGGSRTASYST